jgi:hypothetical protein
MNPQRQAIVDALATVPGLSAVPTPDGPLMAGQAWPAWTQTTWATACLLRTTWSVFVALPATMARSAVDAGDALVVAVADALMQVGQVQRVEPYQWPVDAGQQAIPVLRFTMEV